MHDVEPRLYATVIREMIRHENDVTNHRIMWLLIVQGLIANAYITAGQTRSEVITTLGSVGILVTLSAFIILYKSYQARGYLQFLGVQAKQGTLREEHLPLAGWPRKRIKGWRKNVWICPWLGQFNELLEPYFFLPILLVQAWLFLLMRNWLTLELGPLLLLASGTVVVLISALCVIWVWVQGMDEDT
jgi:hypothetical protein